MSVGRHGLVGLHGAEVMCSGRRDYLNENTQDDVSSCQMPDISLGYIILLQVKQHRDNIKGEA
jgi:hypothetical protein